MGYRGFKISDAAKFCGFSPQGLRFLEDKHIAEPRRDKATGYRYYNLWEIGRILRVKIFRSLGFSMEETLSLTTSSSVEKACSELSRQGAQIADRIQKDRATLLLLYKRASRIASIPKRLGKISREILPAYYQIVYAKLDECIDDAEILETIAHWNSLAPLAHSMPTFHWNGHQFSQLWSTLGVFEESARDCDLPINLTSSYVAYHPSVPALSTIFWTTQHQAEEQFFQPSETPFSLFTTYLRENSLVPAGDCILYPLLTSLEEGESRSYYLCWMPYEERSASACPQSSSQNA